MLTQAEVAIQLRRLRSTGFHARLSQQATAHNLPVPFFFAIASRETNCVNMLGNKQHDGEFRGVGIVQIDIQHPIALEARNDGSWQTNPDPLIAFGAQLLAQNLQQAEQAFPRLDLQSLLKIAASGYNCGVTRAIAAQREGDCDKHTTSHDYGSDVISRMTNFEQLIAEGA